MIARRKQDSYFRMTNNIRKKLKDALSGRKSGSTRSYLGISAKEFKEYIASLFSEGMSWDNYGEWHLDHYVPVAYFKDKPEEMKVCWNYRNLRPLWAKENTDKGDMLPLDAEEHLQRIKDSL